MADFQRWGDNWPKLVADVEAKAPTLKSALASSDIAKPLQELDNYSYLLEKLREKAADLAELVKKAQRPPQKLLGDDTQIKALTKEVDEAGALAIDAGANMKSSAKKIGKSLEKLGKAINKAREDADFTSEGTAAIRALVAYGEKILKLISAGPLVDTAPKELVAAIKRDPSKAVGT